MSSFNELQRRFAFPDPAAARNQHPDPIHIHKYAMNGRGRRQLILQKAGNPAGKDRRRILAAQDGQLPLVRCSNSSGGTSSPRVIHNTRRFFVAHIRSHPVPPFSPATVSKKRKFRFPQNLNPFLRMIIEIPCHFQSWTIQIGYRNRPFQARFASQHFQLEIASPNRKL